jgi:PAS domain S-box-containing protein
VEETAAGRGALPWSELEDAAPRVAAWARARRLPPWSGWAAFAAAYLALTGLGYLLVDPATNMAVWWPPIGLLLAALLVLPPRRWPLAIALGAPLAVGASLLRGRPPGLAVTLMAGNFAQAVVEAWVIRLVAGSPPRVSSVRGALAVGTIPAFVGGVLTLSAGIVHALLADGSFSTTPRAFWSGTSLGALVVAPLALAWLERPAPAPAVRAWELPALAAALATALLLFTTGGTSVWAEDIVLFPPLAWAAFRLGPRGSTATMAITAAVLARFGTAGAGESLHHEDAVQAVQFILAVLGATSLFVAASSEERRRATDELARSRELLDSFFARAPLGMFVKDERHRALVLSSEFAGLLGVPLTGLIGKTVAETLPGPLGEELLELERAAIRGGAPVRHEIAFGDRTFLNVVFPIPRALGDAYVGGLSLEVTDRVRAEVALRESERRLRIVEAALDQASDAVGVVDEDGRYVWVNAACARLLGAPKDRILGRTVFEVMPDVTPDAWRKRWAETAARGALVQEQAIRSPDGRTVPVEVALAIVAFGGRRYLVSSVRDVSDRRRAEAAARLAGIGTLAAGVAHEINNPLAYVLSNVAWLGEHLVGADGRPPPPREEIRRVVDEVQDGAARVRDIVQRLRLFARPEETVGPVQVAAAARAAIAMVQNDLRHRASVITRFAEVPQVLGNENRLAQVFLNLLTNAAQALPEGHAADRSAILVEIGRGERGEVVAEVSDTGSGISPEARARLFEPFFTTKPVGAGIGLGLFVCHGIVAGMGGRIEVESELGAGATFRIVLPPASAEAAAAARPPAAPAPAFAARRARVLVLDDDALVASALRRVLQRDHDVEVSTEPRTALERVRGGEAWDVVFCDLMMPEMSGMEWFEEVRRAAPALADRVVFVTGGAFTDGAREFLDRVANACVEKPFVPDEIRALVARRLAG